MTGPPSPPGAAAPASAQALSRAAARAALIAASAAGPAAESDLTSRDTAGQPVLFVQVSLQLIQPHHGVSAGARAGSVTSAGPAGCTSHQSGSNVFTASIAHRVWPTEDPADQHHEPAPLRRGRHLGTDTGLASVSVARHVFPRVLLRDSRHADRRVHAQLPRVGLIRAYRPGRTHHPRFWHRV